MLPLEIGLMTIGGMALLVFGGMYVPIALMLTSFLGVWAIKGSSVLAAKMLGLAANDAIGSYFFGVVPLFILMGYLVSETKIGHDAFDVANVIFGRVKGGLGIGTVAANAIFAAVTGTSIASAAIFSKIAVPEMLRHGYTIRYAVGVVAGSSVLGMLIPPSMLLILFGLITDQSIGDLFVAGIGPGILLALLFGGGGIAMAYFVPGFVGKDLSRQSRTLNPAEFLTKAGPITALITVVLGGTYTGLFTSVEAGAIGVIGALFFGVVKRRLTLISLQRALVETGIVTASVCFLIIAAQMYSRMLAISGVPFAFGEMAAAANLSVTGLIMLYICVVIALGTILDSSSIMLILVPLMTPIVTPMGVDLVWFGIITVIAVEVGLLTPPFGMSAYVIKSTLGDDSIRIGDIFLGAAPFVLIMLLCLMMVVFFPVIATGLL